MSQKGLRIEILRFAQNDGRSRAAALSRLPVSHILRDHQMGSHGQGDELPARLLEMVLTSVYPASREGVLSLYWHVLLKSFLLPLRREDQLRRVCAVRLNPQLRTTSLLYSRQAAKNPFFDLCHFLASLREIDWSCIFL